MPKSIPMIFAIMLLDLIVFRFVLLPVPAGSRSSPGIAEGSSCAARCAGFDTLCSKVIPNAVSCQNDSRFDSSVTFSFRHVLFWQRGRPKNRVPAECSPPANLSNGLSIFYVSGPRRHHLLRHTGRLTRTGILLWPVIRTANNRAVAFLFGLHYLRRQATSYTRNGGSYGFRQRGNVDSAVHCHVKNGDS